MKSGSKFFASWSEDCEISKKYTSVNNSRNDQEGKIKLSILDAAGVRTITKDRSSRKFTQRARWR